MFLVNLYYCVNILCKFISRHFISGFLLSVTHVVYDRWIVVSRRLFVHFAQPLFVYM